MYYNSVVNTFDFLPHCDKNMFKNCTIVFEKNGKIFLVYIKHSGEIRNNVKSKGLLASSVSTYDFSILLCLIIL